MNALLSVLLYLHFIGGAIALVTFWIPALVKKGSPRHRAAGRIYVKAMWVVLATSLPLSAVQFANGRWVGGTFLLYLFVITSAALYSGTRALKAKQSQREYITTIYVALAWAMMASGVAVLALGMITKTWLLAGFSLIGISAGSSAIAFTRKPSTDRRYWWYEHFGGMIGTGIAAHVAFLNFGAQRLFPAFNLGGWGMLAWFVPVVAGIVATNLLERYYRRKFSAAAAVTPAASTALTGSEV